MNPDPVISGSVETILGIIVLIICGVFTAAQKAIADVNRNNIRSMAEDGDKKAQKLLKLLEKSSKVLATNFTAITFLGLFACQLIAINHAGTVYELLEKYGIPFVGIISVLILALISSIIFLVFAIFFPRQIARQHTEGTALKLSSYASFMIALFKPLTVVVGLLTNIFLKIARQKTGIYEEKITEEDVKSAIEIGKEAGVIKEEGKKMLDSVFAFDDKLAYEIMTPRTDVFLIDLNDPVDEYIDDLMELRYSRIPVCEDESDNIIGILHIKDYLIKAREQGFDNVDIRSILRKPYFVPETKNIDSLFFELQKAKQHIAILIDEYGGFSGIVTMEDIIEEVMGDIEDEYDPEEEAIEKVDENTYLVDGNVYLSDFNEEAGSHLESESSETIGGFIIDLLGEIPAENDKDRRVEFENYVFTILSIKERRIEKVKVEIIREVEEAEEEEE